MVERAAIAFADTCNIGIAGRYGMKELLSAQPCFLNVLSAILMQGTPAITDGLIPYLTRHPMHPRGFYDLLATIYSKFESLKLLLCRPGFPMNISPSFWLTRFHSSRSTVISDLMSSTIASILISIRSKPNGSSNCIPIPSIP